jgi:hypothetical protein
MYSITSVIDIQNGFVLYTIHDESLIPWVAENIEILPDMRKSATEFYADGDDIDTINDAIVKAGISYTFDDSTMYWNEKLNKAICNN